MDNRTQYPPPPTVDVVWNFFRKIGYGRFDENGKFIPPGEDGADHRPDDKIERRYYPANREDLYRRARNYVAKMPVSVSGSHGHDAAFEVALVLRRGFDLTFDEAWPLMSEFNQRCQPLWSESELRHKLDDADRNGKRERGYLLKRSKFNGQTPDRYYFETKQPEEEGAEPPPPEPVKAFPAHCFPDVLSRFAYEIADALSCPVDFPAVTMLAVAASALGASRSLAVKRRWTECPRFYIAEVADPGSAKTPAVNIVCRPMYRRQDSLAANWREEVKTYEAAMEVYEAARKKAGSKNAPPSALPPKPVKPPFPHLFTTDATTESLAPMLQHNPRGMILVRDEVTGWVLGMNQYKGGKGADRQFWLSAWSGEPLKVDRKSQDAGPVIVPHPLINVVGGIQPDMLSELRDERAREDGFVHRILFSYPPAMYGGEWQDAAPSEELESVWEGVVEWLYSINLVENDGSPPRPYIIKLTPEAKEFWVRWYNEHAAEMRQPGFSPWLIGPWSKMRSYCARIALVVHYLRLACGETEEEDVDGDSMMRAAAIADYFKSHAHRVYSRLKSDPEDTKAEEVLAWIKANGGECTGRQLQRARFVKKSSQATALMDDLVDRGFGRIEVRKSGVNEVRWFISQLSQKTV